MPAQQSIAERARSLKTILELLGSSMGFIETENAVAAREFYDMWAQFNRDCCAAGLETSRGNFSYALDQLDRVLNHYPAEKTTIGILEVFPPQFPGSAFLFGDYLVDLERVAKTQSLGPN